MIPSIFATVGLAFSDLCFRQLFIYIGSIVADYMPDILRTCLISFAKIF